MASVFDPMGLFAPILIVGKVLLQKMWDRKLGWDDIINDKETLQTWSVVETGLAEVSLYTVQRLVALQDEQKVSSHLLCFCNASTVAYAATVYLHQQCGERSTCNLIFAKTRIAPVKGMTVPKLELMAVLIGVRCLTFVKDQLKMNISSVYLWTDSQVVIGWINSEKMLPVFVKNSVNEIKNHKEVTTSYVNTKENPADVATKGTRAQLLYKDRLWWHGPKWLEQPIETWITGKKSMGNVSVEAANETVDTEESAFTNTDSVKKVFIELPLSIDYERYSSITKLLRITAYALRFKDKECYSVRC